MTTPPGYTSPNAPNVPYGQNAPNDPYGQNVPNDPYGQNVPMTPPPPEPEKKKSWFARHKILTVLGIVAILVIGNAAFSGGGDDEPNAGEETVATQDQDTDTQKEGTGTTDDAVVEDVAAEEPAEAPEPPAETGPGIGDTVEDGKFEFTIVSIETGVEKVGSQYLSETPQGQYVLVEMTVTNVGKEAQYLFDSEQYLFDTEDRKHSADSTAGIYLENNDMFLSEINPGNTLTGTVVFDIPADAVPASMELHDSMFSGGVDVSLAE